MAKKVGAEKLILTTLNPDSGAVDWMRHPYPVSLACLIFGSLDKVRSATLEDSEFPKGTPAAVEKLSRGLLADNCNNWDVLNFVPGRPIETAHKYACLDGTIIQNLAEICSSEADLNYPSLSALLARRNLFDYAQFPARIPRIVATYFTLASPEKAFLCGTFAANWHDVIFRLRKKILDAIEASLREIKINPERPFNWCTRSELDTYFKKAKKKNNQVPAIFKKNLTLLQPDEFEGARANLEREFVFAEPIFYKDHPYPQQIPGWPCPEEEAECLHLLDKNYPLVRAENVPRGETTSPNSTGNGNGTDLPQHSPDFRSVVWNNESHNFKPIQAAIVKILWENWKKDTPEISAQYLLESADSQSERLDLVFRGNRAWGKMIIPGTTKGTYRLALTAK